MTSSIAAPHPSKPATSKAESHSPSLSRLGKRTRSPTTDPAGIARAVASSSAGPSQKRVMRTKTPKTRVLANTLWFTSTPSAAPTPVPVVQEQLQQKQPQQEHEQKHEKVQEQAQAQKPKRRTLAGSISVGNMSLQVLCVISSGATAIVYKVLDVRRKATCALKVVQGDLLSNSSYDMCSKEPNILDYFARNNAEYVARLMDGYKDKNTRDIFMLMEEGDCTLAAIMRIMRQKPLRMGAIKELWFQLVRAVDEIHRYSVVHRDLKPANLIMAKGELKLIDFGYSTSLSRGPVALERIVGTPGYMSPEAYVVDKLDTKNLTFATDIWSLGVILYEMIYGANPFVDKQGKTAANTKDKDYQVSFAPVVHAEPLDKAKGNDNDNDNDNDSDSDANATVVSPNLIKTIKRCLVHDRDLRPTAAMLLAELDSERDQ
ncbi:kinase-like domain-containing protein [Gongronella butleri]|nr:kinase-like domain-containing protein [Gongronella butleri]